MVQEWPQPYGDDTGCELVVHVEQRDGQVAGWLCFVYPLALIEQGDAALGYVGWQGSWTTRLEALAEHGSFLRVELGPKALGNSLLLQGWQPVA